MKTINASFTTHLAGDSTRLATCWRIVRRDGVTLYFTDHDRDLVFEGNTYVATAGFDRTAVANDLMFSVDNLDVVGLVDAAHISESAIRAGAFDGAEVFIFLVVWDDPTTKGALKIRKGKLGNTQLTPQGYFTAEIRGLAQPLQQNTLRVITPDCHHDVGDAQCTFPIWPDAVARNTAYAVGDFVRASNPPPGVLSEDFDDRIYECTVAGTTHASVQPTYDTVIGNSTVDGTATFKAYDAFTRSDVVASVTSDRQFAGTNLAAFTDGRFNFGLLLWETGNNAGVAYEVQSFVQSGQVIKLWEPARLTVQVGDKYRISPGCAKRIIEDCRDKFKIVGSTRFNSGNAVNFGGFPYVPGAGFAASNPKDD